MYQYIRKKLPLAAKKSENREASAAELVSVKWLYSIICEMWTHLFKVSELVTSKMYLYLCLWKTFFEAIVHLISLSSRYEANYPFYNIHPSSGSSGRVRGGAEKHEIYAAAFGGHLFYDLFLQGRGGAMAPSAPPWIRYCIHEYFQACTLLCTFLLPCSQHPVSPGYLACAWFKAALSDLKRYIISRNLVQYSGK